MLKKVLNIYTRFGNDELKLLRSCNLSNLHFSLGMWIRNEFIYNDDCNLSQLINNREIENNPLYQKEKFPPPHHHEELSHIVIEELIKKIKVRCEEYKNIDENHEVKPAFHIIYGLATKDPGRDRDYIKNLQHDVLMQYIQAAQKENFAVIIDLQLGVLTPSQAVEPILQYLKYDNVHIALDPEFKIPTHRRYPPGKYVGHISGKDINEVQNLMQDFMINNNIQGERKLLVHMFHKRMVRKKSVIKIYDNIDLVFNIDGHGNTGTKIKIYNSLYNADNAKIASSGFKVFYKGDQTPLATPRQILGLDNAGSRKVNNIPKYINYH